MDTHWGDRSLVNCRKVVLLLQIANVYNQLSPFYRGCPFFRVSATATKSTGILLNQ